MRERKLVLHDISELVYEEGYLYALCWMLFEDFMVVPAEMHQMDVYSRLSVNEAMLLVGFLVKGEINKSYPSSLKVIIDHRVRTYQLLKELHSSFNISFIEKLNSSANNLENTSKNDFFGGGDMMLEPIFYSGTGAYDFQYTKTLKNKYAADVDWLTSKKNFYLEEAVDIFETCKRILFDKREQVHLLSPVQEAEFKEVAKENYKGEDFDSDYPDLLYVTKFHQYFTLLFDKENFEDQFKSKEHSVKSFCDMILDLSTLSKDDFSDKDAFDRFLCNFSFNPTKTTNFHFNEIGDYNIAVSHPLVAMTDKSFFLPVSFVLAQSISESPFYWMMKDKSYRSIASENRGDYGELSVYKVLKEIFGDNAYMQVDVQIKKGMSATDIDILCILGSRAFCLQVKSKKLTALSRRGDDESLLNDFKGAVQDAYKQGLTARKAILNKEARFFDADGNKIDLIDQIEEVYIGVLVTEHYPSLLHQVSTYLDKDEGQPTPVAFTLFDLEIIAHYLSDPYDFMYYLRQRVSTADNFHGEEEMSFLGWHLKHKLWVSNKNEIFMIDNYYAQLIDRNYFPKVAGINTPDETDPLLDAWSSDSFNLFLSEIKRASFSKKTDIIFYLLDMSGDARNSILSAMDKIKGMTKKDGKDHNLSVPPDSSHRDRFGLSFYCSSVRDTDDLKDKLSYLCRVRKYKSKAHRWLGVGFCGAGSVYADMVMYSDTEWAHDEELETQSKDLRGGTAQFFGKKKKVGRNDKCPCGSGLKFKKCCVDKLKV